MTFADGGNKVDTASCVLSGHTCHFKAESFIGIYGDEIVKVGAFANLQCIDAIDAADVGYRRGLTLLHSFATCLHVVATAQAILLDFGRRHVGVHITEFTVFDAEKTISIGIDFQKAFSHLVTHNVFTEYVPFAFNVGFGRFHGSEIGLDFGVFHGDQLLSGTDVFFLLGSATTRGFGCWDFTAGYLQDDVNKFAFFHFSG